MCSIFIYSVKRKSSILWNIINIHFCTCNKFHLLKVFNKFFMGKIYNSFQNTINSNSHKNSSNFWLEMEIRSSRLESKSNKFHNKFSRIHRVSFFKYFMHHSNSTFTGSFFLILIFCVLCSFLC